MDFGYPSLISVFVRWFLGGLQRRNLGSFFREPPDLGANEFDEQFGVVSASFEDARWKVSDGNLY